MGLENDEDLLDYALLHSETDLALFHRDHVVRILKLVGKEVPTDLPEFVRVDKYEMRSLVEEARRRMIRRFPILMDSREQREHPSCPRSIPWAMLAPHEQQALSNHSQTLQRLAERGGLGPCEAVAILEDRRWQKMSMEKAVKQLNDLVARFVDRKGSL